MTCKILIHKPISALHTKKVLILIIKHKRMLYKFTQEPPLSIVEVH